VKILKMAFLGFICVETFLFGSLAQANPGMKRADKTRIACAITGSYGLIANRLEKDSDALNKLIIEMDVLIDTFQNSDAGIELSQKSQHYRYYLATNEVKRADLKLYKSRPEQLEFEKGLALANERYFEIRDMEDLIKSDISLGLRANYQIKTSKESSPETGFAVRSAINYFNLVYKLEKMLRKRMKDDYQVYPEFYKENTEVYNQYTKLLNKIVSFKNQILENIYSSMGGLENSSTTPVSLSEFKSILETMSFRSAEEYTKFFKGIYQSQNNLIDAYLAVSRYQTKIYKIYNRFNAGKYILDYRSSLQDFQPIKNWDSGLDALKLEIIEKLGSVAPNFKLDSQSPFLAKGITLESSQMFLDNLLSRRDVFLDAYKALGRTEYDLDLYYLNILLGMSRNKVSAQVFGIPSIAKRLGELPDQVILLMQKEVERFNSAY